MEAKMEKLGRPRFFACTHDYVLYGLGRRVRKRLGAHFIDPKIAQISNKDQDLAGYLDLNLVLSNTNTRHNFKSLLEGGVQKCFEPSCKA